MTENLSVWNGGQVSKSYRFSEFNKQTKLLRKYDHLHADK